MNEVSVLEKIEPETRKAFESILNNVERLLK